MSDLTTFRDHARTMSTAKHTQGCPLPAAAHDYAHTCNNGCTHLNQCHGCVTDSERALWARLADEADAFLAREPEAALFDEATS